MINCSDRNFVLLLSELYSVIVDFLGFLNTCNFAVLNVWVATYTAKLDKKSNIVILLESWSVIYCSFRLVCLVVREKVYATLLWIVDQQSSTTVDIFQQPCT